MIVDEKIILPFDHNNDQFKGSQMDAFYPFSSIKKKTLYFASITNQELREIFICNLQSWKAMVNRVINFMVDNIDQKIIRIKLRTHQNQSKYHNITCKLS